MVSECDYDITHIENVWNVIKREIIVDDVKDSIPIEVKKGILKLKNTVYKIFKASNQLILSHYATNDYMAETYDSIRELDQMLPYLNENTYIACKEVLEAGIELGKELENYKKWEWKIEAKCIRLQYNVLVEKNL